MFIIFGGLPGTGKSTIARRVADELGAVYLRIDTIEQAIRDAGILATGGEVGPAGYNVAYRIATDNLRAGRTVVADSVNPIGLTRDAFRAVGEEIGAGVLEVEVVCSDATEHRRRVETRSVDVPGLVPPAWQAVVERHYELWDRPHLVIDTGVMSVEESVRQVCDALSGQG